MSSSGSKEVDMQSDEDEIIGTDMFQEPQDYREAQRQATYTEYTMLSGQALKLRLVGHNPLWVPTFISCQHVWRKADGTLRRAIISGTVAKSCLPTYKITLQS